MLLRRAEYERAMDAEMQFHLDMESGELERAGHSPLESRRRARAVFGGIDVFKEEGRDVRGTRAIEDLNQDIRYAWRQLRAHPGFALATILTLALGIGATTMIYGFHQYLSSDVNALESPERIVVVGQGPEGCPWCVSMAAGNFETIRTGLRALERVSMYTDWEPVLRGRDHTELVDGTRVTTEFFATAGVRPLIGRLLTRQDSANPLVVISEGVWRSRFDGDPGVLGEAVILDRVAYTIVGVVAGDRVYPRGTEYWAPLVVVPSFANDRENAEYRVIGRLREGVAVDAASAEAAALGARVAAEFAEMQGSTYLVKPIVELSQPSGRAGATRLVASGLVLLIACINLAGLLIARLSARRREVTIRRALGAGSARIVRQLLAETLLLTILGGLSGVVIAVWWTRASVVWADLPLNLEVLGFALVAGLLSGVVIGFWPALRFVRPPLARELREATRLATRGVDAARGRQALVVAQVALAILLLSAAGLLTRSFWNILAVDTGFDPGGVLAMRTWSPPLRSGEGDADRVDRLVEAIEALPQVERAGAALGLPFGHGASTGAFEIEGRGPLPVAARPRVRMQSATPRYFATLGIPLVRGRTFRRADHASAGRVAVINESFAQQHFSGEEPIGRAVIVDSTRWEIVGIVANVFYGDIEQIAGPELYRPMQQHGRANVWIVARTRGDPAAAVAALRNAVRAFDPDVAITRLNTMNELRAADMGSERLTLRMMVGFALVAVIVSAIGLYGLISWSVSQRGREFGVRLALGARRHQVLRLVLGQGMRITVIGVLVGVTTAFATSHLMQSMLFGVAPADPLTLAAVAGLVMGVAMLAALVPARRAIRVDALISLREE
jgi:predicted permease